MTMAVSQSRRKVRGIGKHETLQEHFLGYGKLSSCLLAMVCFSAAAWGNTEYYRHVVFDNSLTPDSYFYSNGMANGSSFLELKEKRLPVETKTFLTPPNALRLQWQSQAGGGWEAEVRVHGLSQSLPGT